MIAVGGKIVHLKEYLPAAGEAFGGLVCTVFINFTRISGTNFQNTHTITIKSCNKAIGTIFQARTEYRSHLSLGLCACIRKDDCRVINILLIWSIIHMLNSLFSFKWCSIKYLCIILTVIRYKLFHDRVARDINVFSRIDVDRCDDIEVYWSLKADISWIWVHYIM